MIKWKDVLNSDAMYESGLWVRVGRQIDLLDDFRLDATLEWKA
jgi:hypothetical protein